MAHGSNRPALARYSFLLVLCSLSARRRRVPATGEGREYRPIHGQDGIRITREPSVVQPSHAHHGLVALHLIIIVLALHSAMEEVLEDPIPGECEEGYSAAGVHLARFPPGTLLLLHPKEQAQRLSAAMLSVHGLSHRRIHRLDDEGEDGSLEGLCRGDCFDNPDSQYRPAGGKKRMGTRKHLPRQACHRQYRHAPCARKQRFAHPMQHLYGYHFGGSLPHLPSTQEEESRQYCFIYPCHHRGSLPDARLQSAATCAQHEGR